MVVGWRVSTSFYTALALDAPDMALWRRRRDGADPVGNRTMIEPRWTADGRGPRWPPAGQAPPVRRRADADELDEHGAPNLARRIRAATAAADPNLYRFEGQIIAYGSA